MKAMILGSCRVYYPLLGMPNVIFYPGGTVHYSGQIIQAFNIMSKNIDIPKYLEKKVFKGWSKKQNKKYDISKIDKFVIEISSLKKIYFDNSKILLNIDYFEGKKNISGVNISKESKAEFFYNMDVINKIIDDRPVLFVSHNNIPNLKNRKLIIKYLLEWCGANKKNFIDPTILINKYKVKKCFEKNDYNHYSLFFRKKMKRYIGDFLKDINS